MLRKLLAIVAVGCQGTASSPGSGPPDAGAPDGPATHDSTGATAPLFPLAVGYSWTYSITGTCAGTFQRMVISAMPVDGRPAFQVTGCSITVDYSVPGGDEVDVDVLGNWLVLVDPLLAEGHTWTYSSTSYTWHRETSVTVPAGTFTDCWTSIPSAQSFPTNTYCRGVGLVHSASSSSDQVLTAKNF